MLVSNWKIRVIHRQGLWLRTIKWISIIQRKLTFQEKLTDTFKEASLKMKTTYRKIMEASAKQDGENVDADDVEDRFRFTVWGK